MEELTPEIKKLVQYKFLGERLYYLKFAIIVEDRNQFSGNLVGKASRLYLLFFLRKAGNFFYFLAELENLLIIVALPL